MLKNTTPRLLLMHGDEAIRVRISRAARRDFGIHTVSTWDDLRNAVIDSPPGSLALLDPFTGYADADDPAAELARLIAAFPSVAFVAVVKPLLDLVHGAHALAQAGVQDVIVLGHDDVRGALTQRLHRGRERPLRTLLDATLPATTSGEARAIVLAAADVVIAAGLSGDLARELGMARRTLLRWCRRTHLPPPRRLLAWIRVLQAAGMLDERGRTVAGIARACGYSTEAALRRVTHAFIGQSPSALQRRGAAAAAAREFVRELSTLAPGPPAAGAPKAHPGEEAPSGHLTDLSRRRRLIAAGS